MKKLVLAALSKMEKKTTYILMEGSEGTGKTTQVKILAEYLRAKGFSVLETKEPGTLLSPLSMIMRDLMLNGKYENEMTMAAREMISQSIRSVSLQNVIYPALGKYDYIVQDRGILSGLAYGEACGNDYAFMEMLATSALGEEGKKRGYNMYNLYDHVVYFKGDISKGLERAKSAKQEFEAGDAMENKGVSFLEKVNNNFEIHKKKFGETLNILVEGKSIEDIHLELLKKLEL
jgi:dTMP kinase